MSKRGLSLAVAGTALVLVLAAVAFVVTGGSVLESAGRSPVTKPVGVPTTDHLKPSTTVTSPGGPEAPDSTKVKILDYVAAPDTPPERFMSRSARELTDPLLYGISWKFRWKTLEPAQGQYDWGLVDRDLQLAARAGKKVALRVYSGIESPDWVYTAGAVPFDFSNSDVLNPGQYSSPLRMPVPWDPTYLVQWTDFVREFGSRYSGNPDIYLIEMAGAGFIGEMSLPHSSADVLTRWRQAGFTDQADVDAWKRIIDSYRSAFPQTPSALDIGEPLGYGKSNVMTAVTDFCLEKYPQKVFLQQNGLQAGYEHSINPVRLILRQAATRTVIGYQMYGGKGTILSAKTGDRRTAFRVAIEDGAQYVEVYDADIGDSANHDALSYLASGGKP